MKTKHSPMRGIQGRPLSKIMLGVLFLAASLFVFQRCTRDAAQKEPAQSPANRVGTNSVTTTLPGGRAYYVVTVMGATVPANYAWSRIARYTFATNGTVAEEFNYWDQDFTGDASTNKVLTGFTTNGCPHGPCNIKTPIGFQPGATPSSLSGTYTYDSNGRLVITWTGGSYETWDMSVPTGKAYTKLTIFNSNYNVKHGYGFGSIAPFTTGATIAQIKAGGSLTNYIYWQNQGVGYADVQSLTSPLYLATFTQCTTPTLTGPETDPDPCKRYASYFAAHITPTLRKTYWNHQQGVVRCADGGGECISPGGGHTTAMLQIIDDAGVFQGLVAAEASLHSMTPPPGCQGCAVIGSMYWVR